MTQFRPSRFEILPTVIKNLLIINVLFFLAKVTIDRGEMSYMVDLLGLHHVKSPLFQPWQIITHLFMHGNLMHLIGNMFALWMFGSILEGLWGPKRFLTFYFVCGIGAGVIHLLFLYYDYHQMLVDFELIKQSATQNKIITFLQLYGPRNPAIFNNMNGPGVLNYLASNEVDFAEVQKSVTYVSSFTNNVLNIPTVGASGAVFGILAAFVYLFPNTYLYLYFFVPVKAKWVGLVYFGYEIYSAVQNSAGDNIARWAHIGGGLVGFLLVLTWNKANRRKMY